MISKLNEKTRCIIAICMVITMPVIIITALVLGIMNDADKKKNNENATATNQKIHQYKEERDKAETEKSPDQTDSSSQSNQEIYIPTEEQKKDAQHVAEDFLRAYHSFDIENPEEYLEKAKPYMTEELYSFYKQYPKRGTLEQQKVKVKEVSGMPADFQENVQVWNIEIKSENTDSDGKKTEQLTPYTVQVIKEEGEWKVNEVRIDG
ncbi:hypothetical protein P8807_19020 [Bacillus subtilis]|uniref:hypothetical protein n=1 Tax=Bacillus subtilis TaxID=1423 RepID=UPI002DBF515D|nr:hypothetical protein [Bacillus subtilis]MEC0413619.1 hypothetical protein [Bacillus subtilis]MEC0423279.1 hypothetical protein [Bacillus subtilis]